MVSNNNINTLSTICKIAYLRYVKKYEERGFSKEDVEKYAKEDLQKK